MKHRIFRIIVDANGKVSYDPPTAWTYFTADRFEFRCRKGPFRVRYVSLDFGGKPRTSPSKPIDDEISPFADDRMTEESSRTKNADGEYSTAPVFIDPDQSKKDRVDELRQKHQDQHQDNYIANFGYYVHIEPDDGTDPLSDLTKEGMWC